jgi:hypothetical protein
MGASQAAELQATDLLRVELGPSPEKYTLHGGSQVGVAAGSDWELRVESHLSVRNLMFLLCYARDENGWRDALALFQTDDELLSSTAWGFAAAAERALRHGPLRGYRRLEERSPVLRGRLRMEAQMARGGMPMPLDIVRDEYDIDVPENRLILAAAYLLRRLPLIHSVVRQRLRGLIERLDGVTYLSDPRQVRLPAITRLNRHYQGALVLADIVLHGMSLKATSGRARSVVFALSCTAYSSSSSPPRSRQASADGARDFPSRSQAGPSTTSVCFPCVPTLSYGGRAIATRSSMPSSSVSSAISAATPTSCWPTYSSSGRRVGSWSPQRVLPPTAPCGRSQSNSRFARST